MLIRKINQQNINLWRAKSANQIYQKLAQIGEGSFGCVFKASTLQKGNSNEPRTFFALKQLSTEMETEGFPITALREIKILSKLDHQNILKLIEVVISEGSEMNKNKQQTYLVFEYMDHDFLGLIQNKIMFKDEQKKCIIQQILKGLKYLHEQNILHRDIKRSTNYTAAIDIWSAGCFMAELFIHDVLFPGDKEKRQIQLIFERSGFEITAWPEVKNLPLFSDFSFKAKKEFDCIADFLKKKRPNLQDDTIDLISQMLALNPKQRISASDALNHRFFTANPTTCSLAEMPKIEQECHGLSRRQLMAKRNNQQKQKQMQQQEQQKQKFCPMHPHQDERGQKKPWQLFGNQQQQQIKFNQQYFAQQVKFQNSNAVKHYLPNQLALINSLNNNNSIIISNCVQEKQITQTTIQNIQIQNQNFETNKQKKEEKLEQKVFGKKDYFSSEQVVDILNKQLRKKVKPIDPH